MCTAAQGRTEYLVLRHRTSVGTMIATVIAIFGLSAFVVSYSAAAESTKGHNSACTGKSCKSKAGKTCKKSEVKKHGRCVKKVARKPENGGELEPEKGLPPVETITPAAGAPAGTLVIQVYRGERSTKARAWRFSRGRRPRALSREPSKRPNTPYT